MRDKNFVYQRSQIRLRFPESKIDFFCQGTQQRKERRL